jgi:hypothetical protein
MQADQPKRARRDTAWVAKCASSRPAATAYRVERSGDSVVELPLRSRDLRPSESPMLKESNSNVVYRDGVEVEVSLIAQPATYPSEIVFTPA